MYGMLLESNYWTQTNQPTGDPYALQPHQNCFWGFNDSMLVLGAGGHGFYPWHHLTKDLDIELLAQLLGTQFLKGSDGCCFYTISDLDTIRNEV